MKVIVSHDVDSIAALGEHWKDLVIPKLAVRSSIELFLGRIDLKQFSLRIKEVLKNKLHNLEELMTFDGQNAIPSTFFVGVNNGLGLCYSQEIAKIWIRKILKKGFDVGTHGIEFDNYNGIVNERALFQELSGLENFGIRMHYLRNSGNTVELLNQSGYLFDSTVYELESPYKVGNLWEFPLHIMDTCLFNKDVRWQSQSLTQVKDETLRILEEARNKGIEYFTLLLHDRYFSNSFRAWKEWYIWLVLYLKNNKVEFVSYKKAINELEKDDT